MDKKWYQSKKLIAAIIAAIVAGAREFGIDVPVELLWVVVAYICGQGMADAGTYLGKNMPKASGPQITLPQPQSDLPQRSMPEVATQGIENPVVIPSGETGTVPADSYTGAFYTQSSDTKRAFDVHRRQSYVLTNPDDPAQVEADFLAKYETDLELAKRMYEQAKGVYPLEDISDSCISGDWGYESRWLYHAQRELQIQRDMVAAIKRNPALKYLLGGLGYLLHGVAWNDMPTWARLALKDKVEKAE